MIPRPPISTLFPYTTLFRSKLKPPSHYAIIGRYILPPDIFPLLAKTERGSGGEIQLTDALRELADRKSTRLNSSHSSISYAVFCLKKKKKHLNQLVVCYISD